MTPTLRIVAIVVGLAALAANAAGSAGVAEPPRPPIVGGSMFTDLAGDSGASADLREITPFVDAEGRFGVRLALETNRLRSGTELFTSVDTDGDVDTGVRFGDSMGADWRVGIYALSGQPDHVFLERTSEGQSSSTPSPTLTTFRSGATDVVWAISAAELGLAAPTSVSLAVSALDSSISPADVDLAPSRDPGEPWAFTGAIGSVAGAWPGVPSDAVPLPEAPRGPFPVTLRGRDPGRIKLFVLPAFGLAGTREGIRLLAAWQHGQGRATWSLRLVGRRDGRRLTRGARGAGAAGSAPHVLTRTVPLPAAWRGVAFRATFTATNGTGRAITRVRMVRFPR